MSLRLIGEMELRAVPIEASVLANAVSAQAQRGSWEKALESLETLQCVVPGPDGYGLS